MTRKDYFPVMLMTALSLTPVISIHFPRFIAFWPLIIGLGTAYRFVFIKKELFRLSRIYYLCAGLISFLCLLSVLWSIAPMQALTDALRAGALLMLGGILVSSFHALESDDLKPYGWLLPAGVILAALLCTFDLYHENLSIYKIFHDYSGRKLNTSVMNRGIICCVFAFFLSLPFIQALPWRDKHKFFLCAGSALSIVVMLVFGQSQAGQVAFVLGLIVYFVFPARRRFGYILLGLGLAAGMLATPYIVDFLYDRFIHYTPGNDWASEAFIGNRVEIWQFVMKYALHNPVYGYGIEATGYVPRFDFEHFYNRGDTVLHPHNFSVQIWMEFGLVGVALASGVLGALLFVLYRVRDLFVRKALTALFVTVMLVWSMTYGTWQGWWIGELLFLLGTGSFLSTMRPDEAF